MATFAFDTLQEKQILTDAGVEDRHATAFVDLARKSVSENVATKEDISNLKVDHVNLKSDLKGDMADLKVGIANLKVHMTFGLLAAMGVMISTMGLMTAVLISILGK